LSRSSWCCDSSWHIHVLHRSFLWLLILGTCIPEYLNDIFKTWSIVRFSLHAPFNYLPELLWGILRYHKFGLLSRMCSNQYRRFHCVFGGSGLVEYQLNLRRVVVIGKQEISPAHLQLLALAAAIDSAYARVGGWLVGRASPKTRKHQTAFAHCPRKPSLDSATIVTACLMVHGQSGRQIHATCTATRTPLHLRCTATATSTRLSRSLSTPRALCVIRREG
jgi:hypothetical protein